MNFKILNDRTYLDTARSGGIYSELLDWRKSHEIKYFEMGSEFRIDNEVFIEKVRRSVSSFFGSRASSTCLTQSFSVGFNSLLNLLREDLSFLVYKNDYPSITRSLELNHFDYCKFGLKNNFEEDVLQSIEKENPDVLVISVVQYLNGIFIEPDLFLKVKKLYPKILIIADGTQYCETKKINFDRSGIDVLIASGYKWIYSGYGNGFVLLKMDQIKRFIKKRFEHVDRKSISSFFEPGNLDTLNYGSLKFSLDTMNQIGIKIIEKKINKISEIAKQKFLELELLDPQIQLSTEHSNIFNIGGDSRLYQKLLLNRIICSFRGNGIRVSFGMFNSEYDLEKLITVLRANL